MAVSITILTGCDLLGKKSEKKGGENSDLTAPNDTVTAVEQQPEPAVPEPDNEKAQKITVKYNQGPAINNKDYADALEYAEIYLSLATDKLLALQTADDAGDKAGYQAAVEGIHDLEVKYPYNAELLQILHQAAAIEKTEGGLVPMNDDNRARFEALLAAYDKIGS